MHSHQELTQEELKLLEEGGRVKEATAKERECQFDGLESYIVEKEGKNVGTFIESGRKGYIFRPVKLIFLDS